MKIALVGFSGKGNFGDIIMNSLLKKELSKYGKVTEYSDTQSENIICSNIEHLNNDIIVFGGGNIVSRKFWAFKNLSQLNNKKILFLNVNITRSEPEFLDELSCFNASWTVRDTESQRILEEHGILSIVIPDIATTIKLLEIPKKRQALFFLNQYYFNDLFGDDLEKFIRTFNCAKILAHHADWLNSFGWEIIFVPSQISKFVDDRIVSAFVLRLCKGYSKYKWLESSDCVEKLISESSLVISQRLHPALISVSNCVPTVVLSFHNKFDNLFNDMDLSQIVLDVEGLTHQKLIEATVTAEDIDYCAKNEKYLNKFSVNYSSWLEGKLTQIV